MDKIITITIIAEDGDDQDVIDIDIEYTGKFDMYAVTSKLSKLLTPASLQEYCDGEIKDVTRCT